MINMMSANIRLSEDMNCKNNEKGQFIDLPGSERSRLGGRFSPFLAGDLGGLVLALLGVELVAEPAGHATDDDRDAHLKDLVHLSHSSGPVGPALFRSSHVHPYARKA